MQTSALPLINITLINTTDGADTTSINILTITIRNIGITMMTIFSQECFSAHLIKLK